MDSEPRALRPFVLLATTFVVVGTAAGALLFLMARPPPRAPLVAEGPDEAEAETRALPWPASLSPRQREEIEVLAAKLVDPALPGPAEPADRLRDAGPPAVPRLLTYLHEVASDPVKPDQPTDRLRFLAVERVLTSLRGELTPDDRPPPKSRYPDGAYIRRRARQWFAWWDRAGAPLVR